MSETEQEFKTRLQETGKKMADAVAKRFFDITHALESENERIKKENQELKNLAEVKVASEILDENRQLESSNKIYREALEEITKAPANILIIDAIATLALEKGKNEN